MTDKRVVELFEQWRVRLALHTTRLTVEFAAAHPDDDLEVFAETKPSAHYDDAKIVVYRDMFSKLKDRDAEATIVHELLHVAHRDVEHIVDLLDGQLHRDVLTVVTESFRHAVEGFVDRMAYVLVDTCASKE